MTAKVTLEAQDTRWFAVQSKPNQEIKAAINLERQGFGVYLPKYRRRRSHARRVEWVARPLFAGYLFLSVDTARQALRSINSTFGVLRLVSSSEGPVEVPCAVIDGLRQREDTEGCVQLMPQRFLKPGDKVRVTDGAFASCLGLYQGITDNERAFVLLDLLGRKVRATIDPEALATA